MRMRKHIFVILMFLFFAVPAPAQNETPLESKPAGAAANSDQLKKEIKLSEEDSVYEAAFRIMLGRWLSDNAARYQNYYLKIEGKKDPSDALMEKLSDLGLPVRKGSECFISGKDGSIVLDKSTKKQGILFSVSKLKWISRDEVKFGSYDHEGNMAAFGCTYTLKREDGKWKLEKAVECWVS
jgi:hypothetical protein